MRFLLCFVYFWDFFLSPPIVIIPYPTKGEIKSNKKAAFDLYFNQGCSATTSKTLFKASYFDNESNISFNDIFKMKRKVFEDPTTASDFNFRDASGLLVELKAFCGACGTLNFRKIKAFAISYRN